MHRHRIAWTSLIFGILLVGCGQSRTDHLTAGVPVPIAAVVPAPPETTATTAATTTTTTPPPAPPAPATPAVETAPPAPDPAATARPASLPVVTPPASPALDPATLIVNYQPHDGGTATATLVESGASLAVVNGSAVFADLADGTYTVQIEVIYPTQSAGDTGIGAESAFRAHRIAVQAGDHAVVVCDDSDCTGIS